MHVYSTRTPAGTFCSSASDFRRDGCVDSYGWVADAVNLGELDSSSLIDPASPLKGYLNLNDLLVHDPSDGIDGVPEQRLSAGICGRKQWKGIAAKEATDYFAGSANRSPERAELIARYFVANGYNTNYSASWHLVRSVLKTEVEDVNANANDLVTHGDGQFRGMGGTLGPLKISVMDRSRIASHNIGFVGCAAPGDIDKAVLERTLAIDADGTWADGSVAVHEFIQAGELLSELNTRGPSFWNPTKQRIELISPATPMKHQMECERAEPTSQKCIGPTGTAPNGNGHYLQDTRAWFAVHEGTVNLLMADGAVKVFGDSNADGYFNPGFKVAGSGMSKDKLKMTVGYTDDAIEMPPQEYFAGVFLLLPQRIRAFE